MGCTLDTGITFKGYCVRLLHSLNENNFAVSPEITKTQTKPNQERVKLVPKSDQGDIGVPHGHPLILSNDKPTVKWTQNKERRM